MLLAIALLSIFGILFAATASITGPKRVDVGELVTVKASDLRAGQYRLFLTTPYNEAARPGETTQCSAPISALRHASGTASFSGRVPDVLECRAYLTPTGTRPVSPGSYEFEVYSPVGDRPNRRLANAVQGVQIEK
ncbi:MAG TPA: hypothetical protein VMD48_02175 [Solirubrobacteraceae bacterium]|nr:hypothetical protein [Solirubrobacteraceae bacterium]